MIETKDKILDTAERLFGEQGYAATSLRHIIAEAGVNLAAIHYHFGSKEDLLDELIIRKVGPVNAERLRRLADLETAGAPSVEAILRAFLEPMVCVAQKSRSFAKVMGRVHAEGLMPVVAQRHFREVGERFIRTLGMAKPEVPRAELLWRVHFLMGAMGHMVHGSKTFGLAGVDDPALTVNYLIAFATGAFEAPPVQVETTEVRK
jgi:AcrR family transcriptional regulator